MFNNTEEQISQLKSRLDHAESRIKDLERTVKQMLVSPNDVDILVKGKYCLVEYRVCDGSTVYGFEPISEKEIQIDDSVSKIILSERRLSDSIRIMNQRLPYDRLLRR